MNFLPNTTIHLLSVPLQIDNGCNFKPWKTKKEQEEYFLSKIVYSFDKQSYQRIHAGRCKLDINAELLFGKHNANYIMFKNSNYGDKWFYANILNYEYLTPNTTAINYSIDSWQTFQFELDLSKMSFVERRHWSGKNDDENALMQLPYEDLDIGDDYIYTDRKFDNNDSTNNFEKDQFYYIIMTEPIKNLKSNHIISKDKNTSYLDIGEDGKAKVEAFNSRNGINNVLEGYILNYTCLNYMLETGFFHTCELENALKQVILLPFGRTMFPNNLKNKAEEVLGKKVINAEFYQQYDFGGLSNETNIKGWCSYLNDYINRVLIDDFDFTNGDVKKDLTNSAIGKYLYRYPYSLLEINDFQNQPQTIHIDQLNRFSQYEYIKTNELPIIKYASIGPTPTLTHSIKGYKNSGYRPEQENENHNIDSLSNITNTNLYTMNSLTTLPVESDYLAAFLQSNMNQLQASKLNASDTLNMQINNAGASLQAGSYSAQIAHQNNKINANTQYANAKINADTAYLNMIDSNLGSVGGLLANTAISGAMNPAGAMAGFASGGAGVLINGLTSQSIANNSYSATAAMANNTAAAAGQTSRNNLSATLSQLNTNYANTLRSANVSYSNAMRALNARTKDISNMPNSIQVQGNNSSYFNILNNRDIIMYSCKSINKEAMKRLIDYFARYGFITNRNESIKSILDKFKNEPGVYIKTINAAVLGNIPDDNLHDIKNMFDSGVMLFEPNDFMNYDKMKEV